MKILNNFLKDPPMIVDGKTQLKSVTLTFTYIAGLLSLLSVILLHLSSKLLTATITTLMFWVLATILYMFRSLHKAKIDLDNKSIELESTEKEEK